MIKEVSLWESSILGLVKDVGIFRILWRMFLFHLLRSWAKAVDRVSFRMWG